jgi:hypothetical protein
MQSDFYSDPNRLHNPGLTDSDIDNGNQATTSKSSDGIFLKKAVLDKGIRLIFLTFSTEQDYPVFLSASSTIGVRG